MTTLTPDPTVTTDLADRLFDSMLGTLDVLTIHVGDQLGLYDLLHRRGPLTAAEVAAGAGIDARYAREWLEQQTVAGLVSTEDASAAADVRRYHLTDEHASVLCDRDSLTYLTPFARMLAAAAMRLPELLDAYRTGGGVGWSDFGPLMRTAQADANRPLFLQVLGSDWLPSVPGLDALLRDGGKVADIGCGDGWSSLAIARAYPQVTVDGYDVDADSIDAGRAQAEAEGLADRVRFVLADAGTVPAAGDYDLVSMFECVHDMPDPVGVLRSARQMASPDGCVLVMDEKVPDEFTGPGDPVEQLMYGISMLVCLPDGMSHRDSVGTGTVMRHDTLRGYARAAGFADAEVLPVEHDMFRFYRLV
ncbi:class I SAM-dependent methyltransferase [Nocardioides bigeumensis]|uniref:Class I SAM-dependent methyltransferase n=1 Tax=Nocardioides bigeumensis TaxID=433657 RepID=A0ABN2YFH9_9ACTN